MPKPHGFGSVWRRGFVGLCQVNVVVSTNIDLGPEVILSMTQNGVPSNTVTVGVQYGKLWKDTRGQDLVEYALLLVLLRTAAVATTDRFACELSCVFDGTAQSIEKMRGNIPPGQIIKGNRGCA